MFNNGYINKTDLELNLSNRDKWKGDIKKRRKRPEEKVQNESGRGRVQDFNGKKKKRIGKRKTERKRI